MCGNWGRFNGGATAAYGPSLGLSTNLHRICSLFCQLLVFNSSRREAGEVAAKLTEGISSPAPVLALTPTFDPFGATSPAPQGKN